MQNGKSFLYSIKFISFFDGINSDYENKLKQENEQTKDEQVLNYLNILKDIDEKDLDTTYFIYMEKCESTPMDIAEKDFQQTIDEKQYIEFGLEILHAIKYLQEKNYFLRFIFVNNTSNQNKSNDFQTEKEINSSQQLNYRKKEKSQIFYYPPEILDDFFLDEVSIYSQQAEGEIWLFGICMLILAGASSTNLDQFAKGFESFIIQNSISFDIHNILFDVLLRNKKSRPNIDYIIEQFTNLDMNKNNESEFKLFEFVQKCFNQFEFNQSIKFLNKLIELCPLNDSYIAMLGRAYLEIDMVDESYEQSMKSLQINPLNDISLSNIGYYHYYKYDNQKSLEYIDKCLLINANNYLAQTYKAYILRCQQQFDEVIKICLQVLEQNPNYINAMQCLGEAYRNKSMFLEAIELYKKILSIKPNCLHAYDGLAQIYNKKGNFNQAIEILQKGLYLQPNSALILDQIGNCYYSQRNNDQAIQYYIKALQADPKYISSIKSLGDIQVQKGQYDQALSYYKQYLQINPNQDDVLFLIGNTYSKLSQNNKALCYYKQSLKINPKLNNVNLAIGIIYQQQDMYDLAIKFFRKELQLVPNDEFILYLIQLFQQLV